MVTIASWVVYIDPNLLLPKTKHQKGSKQPFEDVFPIKNGDSALSCEFSGVILTTYRNGVLSSKDPAIETKGRWSSAHVGYQRWPLLSEMPRCVFLFFLVVASDWSILTRGVYLKHSYILWSLEKKTIQIQHNLIWAHTPYMYRGYDPSFDPPQKINVHQKHIHRQCHGKNKKKRGIPVAQRIPRRDVPVPTRISAVSYLLLFYSPKGHMKLQKIDLDNWGGMCTIYTYINLNIKKGSLIDVYTYILCISQYYLIVTCFHLAFAK